MTTSKLRFSSQTNPSLTLSELFAISIFCVHSFYFSVLFCGWWHALMATGVYVAVSISDGSVLQVTSWVTTDRIMRIGILPTYILVYRPVRESDGFSFGVTTCIVRWGICKSMRNCRLLDYPMMIGISFDGFKSNQSICQFTGIISWVLAKTFEREGYPRNTFISYSRRIIFYFLNPKSQKQKPSLGAN